MTRTLSLVAPLVYAAAMAAFCHLFVTGYEERRLSRRFGDSYLEYRRTVPRWIPPPAPARLASFSAGMLSLGSPPGQRDIDKGLPWQSSW